MMNDNDKKLLKLFDIEEDSVQSFNIDLTENKYLISIVFNTKLHCCPHCGSINHTKGTAAGTGNRAYSTGGSQSPAQKAAEKAAGHSSGIRSAGEL